MLYPNCKSWYIDLFFRFNNVLKVEFLSLITISRMFSSNKNIYIYIYRLEQKKNVLNRKNYLANV